jgi:predicted alpha/beta-fold hydrolase
MGHSQNKTFAADFADGRRSTTVSKTKQNRRGDETQDSTDLRNRDEEAFVPRRMLRNAHLQTLAGNFLPRKSTLPAPEERLFQVEKDVQVLCHCHWQPQRESRATVVIVHGLEGSSLSQYVIGTGSKAWDKGMNVVRMNMRNCGGTERLTSTLYHSGLSSDVGAVVRTLIEQDKLQRIALVGYSMGGNLVLKLAGDWGGNAPKELLAVAAVSPAADLAASADAMHEKANLVYEWKFLLSLMRRYRRKRELFPAIYSASARHPRSIREFDDVITARYSGFTGADDYYAQASASRVAERIAVPTLVVHSTDDPFIRMTPATREKFCNNPHVTLIETRHGGHCAFLAHPNGYDGRWAERQIIQFFVQHGLA